MEFALESQSCNNNNMIISIDDNNKIFERRSDRYLTEHNTRTKEGHEATWEDIFITGK